MVFSLQSIKQLNSPAKYYKSDIFYLPTINSYHIYQSKLLIQDTTLQRSFSVINFFN